MSAESDDKINVSPQSVPTLNVQDVDVNQNIRENSSKISSAQGELKSGIITEGDSKSPQSARSGRSSGEYSKTAS